ncbi:MAG: hypothetical protein CMM75_11215 [Rhodospirillaceae bacterium]|nr:hypothetical protein [Rhodospirillaceae bacterium]
MLRQLRIFLSLFCLVFTISYAGSAILANPIDSDKHLAKTLGVSDTTHFLNRVAFGAEPGTFKKYFGKTRLEAINSILSGIRTTPFTPLPNWTLNQAPPFWGRSDMSRGDENLFDTIRTKEFESLKLWWAREIAQTNSPLTERLVLFWHNHFVAAYAGIGRWSISLARQNQTFRKFGSGNFRNLLTRSLKEPALLKYLDAGKNRKGKPNENLGRELLELFTLGEGQYTEMDVKEVSRALTGWRTAQFKNLTFWDDKWAHDNGPKTIFGKTEHYSQEDLINLLLKHPSTAEFITKKFWRYFISETWDDNETIKTIATSFRKSDYEVKVLLRKIFESKAFWSKKARGTIIKSPVDFVLGTIRSLSISPSNFGGTPKVLENMGQELFNPPNVGGWPGYRAWVTPSGLIERIKYIQSLLSEGGIISDPQEIDKIKRHFAFIRSQQNRSGVINQSKLDEIGKNIFNADYMLSAYSRGFGMTRRPHLTVGFINARVNKTVWGTLAVGFDVSDAKGFRIKFREHKCYPRCFSYSNVDPNNSRIKKKRQKGINIYSSDSERIIFKKVRYLNNDEKKMIGIVIGSLDVIADLISDGRRYERHQKYRDWADYLRKQAPKFKNNRWVRNLLQNGHQFLAQQGYRGPKQSMGMMMGGNVQIDGIMPGGRSPISNPVRLKETSLKFLTKVNFADYLLVLPDEFKGRPNSLLKILISPAYNVR